VDVALRGVGATTPTSRRLRFALFNKQNRQNSLIRHSTLFTVLYGYRYAGYHPNHLIGTIGNGLIGRSDQISIKPG